MYNRTILDFLAILLLLGFVSAQAAETTAQQAGQTQSVMANPFDASTWRRHHGGQMRFNFAHPATWMLFIDPNTHEIGYATLMNPANYPQLVQPRFWMQFANFKNWLAWVDPASYTALFNPATYLGWMRPDSYVHLADPGMYTQVVNPGAYVALMNPTLYMQWMNPSAYVAPFMGVNGGATTFNWLSPAARTQAAPPGSTSRPNKGQTGKN